MTYERALKELKRQVQYWKNGIPFAYKLQPLEASVSALEKQIPKNVLFAEDQCMCPCCLFDMMGVYDFTDEHTTDPKFCPECGQALDWSNNQ